MKEEEQKTEDEEHHQKQQQQEQQQEQQIHLLQDQLLCLLPSLDRGIAASSDDVARVDTLVSQIEAFGGAVILCSNLADVLDGRWRLLYSSGFSGGNLGGRRPGPPAALFPLALGPVYQDIFVRAGELDNVVTLTAKFSLASLPFVNAEPPAVNARLRHSFTIDGAATVRIVFENTMVKTSGGIGNWLGRGPQFDTPQLPASLREGTASARGATFDISFLDEKMRITRGDRGELRVFLKE